MERENWIFPCVIIFFVLCFVTRMEAKADEPEPSLQLETISLEIVTLKKLRNPGSYEGNDGHLYYFVPFGPDGGMPMKMAPDAAVLASMFLIAGSERWQVASQEDVEAIRIICSQFEEVREHMACSSLWTSPGNGKKKLEGQSFLLEGDAVIEVIDESATAGAVLVSEPIPKEEPLDSDSAI